MSENSYLRHISAQVSQIVFLAYLTVLQAYYNYMNCNLKKFIACDFSAQVSQIVFFSHFNCLSVITTLWPEVL